MKVHQIDFVASRNQIYWSDSDMNEVKRANLSGSTVETLIDTGISQFFNLQVYTYYENVNRK